jgi:hypothetical protein
MAVKVVALRVAGGVCGVSELCGRLAVIVQKVLGFWILHNLRLIWRATTFFRFFYRITKQLVLQVDLLRPRKGRYL